MKSEFLLSLRINSAIFKTSARSNSGSKKLPLLGHGTVIKYTSLFLITNNKGGVFTKRNSADIPLIGYQHYTEVKMEPAIRFERMTLSLQGIRSGQLS